MRSGRGFRWTQGRPTTTFNFFRRKLISSVLALSVFIFSVFPAIAADSEKKWTLAAEKFTLTQKNDSVSLDYINSTLPALILEQLAENLQRVPRGREKLDRSLYELQKSRIDLFLQLSKEVKTRDSILLNDYSSKKLKMKLKESERKIAEIQKKIDANLLDVRKENDKYALQIEQDENRRRRIDEGLVVDEHKEKSKFAELFKEFAKKSSDVPVIENVVLYQNDFNKFFDAGAEKREAGYASYPFEKACVDAKINGLLTGTVTVYGSYVSCAVSLYQYPGGRLIGSAMDVGSIENLRNLAVSIALQITPRIADSMPVELNISVEPEAALKKLAVTIDGVVYRNISRPIIVQTGVHSVTFASDGFDTISTDFGFYGSRKFKVDVEMRETKIGDVKIRLAKPYSGDIFGNGIFAGSVTPENPFGTIKVDGRNVLGHFMDSGGTSADFLIPAKLLKDGEFLSVNAKPFDRSDYIEKRRRWMYASYSALIVSLVPTFYIYGNSFAKSQAYNNNVDISYEDARNWQTASNVMLGVSATAGAFFVYELIRYLVAAENVLPKAARPLSRKEKQSLMREQLENQKKSEPLPVSEENPEDDARQMQDETEKKSEN